MSKAKLPKGVEELPSGRYRAITWNRCPHLTWPPGRD